MVLNTKELRLNVHKNDFPVVLLKTVFETKTLNFSYMYLVATVLPQVL